MGSQVIAQECQRMSGNVMESQERPIKQGTIYTPDDIRNLFPNVMPLDHQGYTGGRGHYGGIFESVINDVFFALVFEFPKQDWMRMKLHYPFNRFEEAKCILKDLEDAFLAR